MAQIDITKENLKKKINKDTGGRLKTVLALLTLVICSYFYLNRNHLKNYYENDFQTFLQASFIPKVLSLITMGTLFFFIFKLVENFLLKKLLKKKNIFNIFFKKILSVYLLILILTLILALAALVIVVGRGEANINWLAQLTELQQASIRLFLTGMGLRNIFLIELYIYLEHISYWHYINVSPYIPNKLINNTTIAFLYKCCLLFVVLFVVLFVIRGCNRLIKKLTEQIPFSISLLLTFSITLVFFLYLIYFSYYKEASFFYRDSHGIVQCWISLDYLSNTTISLLTNREIVCSRQYVLVMEGGLWDTWFYSSRGIKQDLGHILCSLLIDKQKAVDVPLYRLTHLSYTLVVSRTNWVLLEISSMKELSCFPKRVFGVLVKLKEPLPIEGHEAFFEYRYPEVKNILNLTWQERFGDTGYTISKPFLDIPRLVFKQFRGFMVDPVPFLKNHHLNNYQKSLIFLDSKINVLKFISIRDRGFPARFISLEIREGTKRILQVEVDELGIFAPQIKAVFAKSDLCEARIPIKILEINSLLGKKYLFYKK